MSAFLPFAVIPFVAALGALALSFYRKWFNRPARWMLRGAAAALLALAAAVLLFMLTAEPPGMGGIIIVPILIMAIVFVGPIGLAAGWIVYHIVHARRLIAKGGTRKWYSYSAISIALLILLLTTYVTYRHHVYTSCLDPNLSHSQVVETGLRALASKDRLVLHALAQRGPAPAELVEAVRQEPGKWLDAPLNTVELMSSAGWTYFLLLPLPLLEDNVRSRYVFQPSTLPASPITPSINSPTPTTQSR
ncbi:MAG: hypothetical protein U0R19_12950 [Bryobacteraceae bacterium]